MLRKLIPGYRLSATGGNPRQAVGKISVEVERRRRALQLADCDLIKRDRVLYQMLVEDFGHTNFAREGTVFVERARIFVGDLYVTHSEGVLVSFSSVPANLPFAGE